MQQNVLWAEVQKETGRWKSRWKIRDLLADKRCEQAVLNFLTSTYVGRPVPPLEEGDARSEVSEWELRERREREEEQEAEAEELSAAGGSDAGEDRPLFLPTPSFMASADEESGADAFPMSFSFVIPLVRTEFSWDRPGRRAKGSSQRATARTADRKTG